MANFWIFSILSNFSFPLNCKNDSSIQEGPQKSERRNSEFNCCIHQKKKIKLWGLNKDGKFLEKSIYLTLFKDIKGYGAHTEKQN